MSVSMGISKCTIPHTRADYEGLVSLWDAYTGQRLTVFEEHEKRAWSVDVAPSQPTLLASGSDDCKVCCVDVWMCGSC